MKWKHVLQTVRDVRELQQFENGMQEVVEFSQQLINDKKKSLSRITKHQTEYNGFKKL